VEEKFFEELTARFIEALDSQRRHMVEAVRESWADVEESSPFAASATTLDIPAQSENEERIFNIIIYAGVPAGNCALLELGIRQPIAVPAGQLVSLTGVWRLRNTDKRRISSATVANNAPGAPGSGAAGFLQAALFGKEVPVGALRW
jgi:hypothetical protein